MWTVSTSQEILPMLLVRTRCGLVITSGVGQMMVGDG